MTRPRWLYTACLPIVWAIICGANFRAPGDEYGGWAVGSLAGLWALWLVPASHQGRAPADAIPPVMAAGVCVMAALGVALDKLHCPLVVFLFVWLSSAAALVGYELSKYPTYERAISKNGSIDAYVLSTLNLCLLGTAVAMIAIVAVWRAVHSSRRPRLSVPIAR